MNKFILTAIFIILLSNGCTQSERETLYNTKATIYLINETSDTVFSEDGCHRNILMKDTLIIKEDLISVYSEKPSINNYYPFSKGFCHFFYDKEKIICQEGLRNVENYVNRNEIAPLEFEFTFKFTEEKKKNSQPCN